MPDLFVATCSECGAEMLFITLLTREGGKQHPVDRDPVAEPAVGLIAVRRIEMQGMCGLVLTAERMARRLEEFEEKGCAWHASHFATCSGAAAIRSRPNPDQLGLLS